MKQILSLMAAAMMFAIAGHAMAASGVDLSVKGSITPAACTPTLSSGGVVDHGKISRKDLNQSNKPTALPLATLQLSVECAAPTIIAVKSRDNRAGSSGEEVVGGQSNFGLGFVNGNKKVGWYMLKTAKGQADGIDRPMIESSNGTSWSDATHPGLVWQANTMRALSETTGSGAAPLPLQVMTMDIEVETMIVRTQFLPTVGEGLPIDGSATLDIVYL